MNGHFIFNFYVKVESDIFEIHTSFIFMMGGIQKNALRMVHCEIEVNHLNLLLPF